MAAFSVVIPAFNEENGIHPVLERIRSVAPNAEVIVVDDGSTDETAKAAETHGVKVVRHPVNAGYGASLKSGIRAATTDIILISDADGSYPVERMQEFATMMDKGFDMVVGARQGTSQYDSFLKIPARMLFKFLVEFTTGRRIPDINSGFRVFRKSQVMPYFPDLCQGFSFTTTITLIYMLTGKFVTYVPIAYDKRIGRSKVKIIRDSLRTLQYITEVIAMYNPLKLFLLLTGILAVFSIASFILAFWLNIIAFFILASLTFVGSFLTFGMGLIAVRSHSVPSRP